jgi:hypothetical protein
VSLSVTNSRVRKNAILGLIGFVRNEVLRQMEDEYALRVNALKVEDPVPRRSYAQAERPTLVSVRVPLWLYEAMKLVEGLPEPLVLGVPLVVWEHEDIEAVFHDITMAPLGSPEMENRS